ncbi:hypothetical protein [Chitinibacter sp. S2-10]|uniref:hypothetical protein n=1 Tax=Chitinibacter sp. S2-10 TaxID=3373597 RepID=UPI003977A189
MRQIYRMSLKGIAWIATAFAGWNFLGDWLAPDYCLDFSGAFDYVNWRCSYDDGEAFPYIAFAAYSLPSFQLFAGLLVLAIVLQVALRRPRTDA